MTDRETIKLALEAFETWMQIDTLEDAHTFEMITAPEAMAALRQALDHVPDTTKMIEPDMGIDRGAWDDVPDATKWVDELRGGDETVEEEEEPVGQYSDIVSDGGLDPRNQYDTAPPKPAQDLIVGYADSHDIARDGHDFWVSRQPGKNTVPLYLYGHPPKIWQGLTGDEVNDLKHWLDHRAQWSYIEFARAIEAKLKEKNRE